MPAAAYFAPAINVSALDGTNGFRIVGAKPGDAFGWSVLGGTDVNGDGLRDVLISAISARGAQSAEGKVYVLYGQRGDFAATLNASQIAGAHGFQIVGSVANGRIGSSLASGDVNGDGYADIVIGGHNLSLDGASSGGAYVVFGRAAAVAESTVKVSQLDGTNGYLIRGMSAGANGGFAVGACDIDSDGKADVLVGAISDSTAGSSAGATYVIHGAATSTASISVAALAGAAGFKLFGREAGERIGFSFAAGDFNGDGMQDAVIGAPNGDAKGANTGGAYVLFGSKVARTSPYDLLSLEGAGGFRIIGVEANTRSGWSVGAGDVNGDGIADVFVGQIDGAPNGIFHAGATFVVYGTTAGFADTVDLAHLRPEQGFAIQGFAYQQETGCAVSDAGDVNGDGIRDILIGAQHGDPGGNTFPSSAFVVFGKAGGFRGPVDLSQLDGTDGFRIDDERYGGQLGVTVSAAGDINGDGYDDIIVGSRFDRRLASFHTDPGSAYVIYGHAVSGEAIVPVSRNLVGTAAQDNLFGNAADDRFDMRQGGNDFVFGDRGDDTFLFGATFTTEDSIDGGRGFDTLVLDGDYDTSVALLQGTVNNIELIEVKAGHSYSLRPGYNTVLAGQTMTIDGSALGAADKLTVTAPKASARGDVMKGTLVVKGGAGADKLSGGPNGDEIHGGAGADYVTGGKDDRLYGDDGNDRFVIDGAPAIVDGGKGDDSLTVSVSLTLARGAVVDVETILVANGVAADLSALTGDLRIYSQSGVGGGASIHGGQGANMMMAGNGKDHLVGGGAADRLYGSKPGGTATLAGAAGDDTYYVTNITDRVVEARSEGNDRIYASVSYRLEEGQEIEILSTAAPSATTPLNLTGNAFDQTLYGNKGANLLDGKAGADTLYGYGGDDTYRVDNPGDRVVESIGGGYDRVLASVGYALSGGQEIERLEAADRAQSAAIDLTGNEFGQVLVGNAGANVLDGRGGADVLQGLGGDDTYHVDNSGDRVIEAVAQGFDTIVTTVDVSLASGQEIELLKVLPSVSTKAIKLTGNGFDQTLIGNDGANRLDGGAGADRLEGLGGDDVLCVDDAADVVIEAVGGGNDRVLASVSYTLTAGQEIELLSARDLAGTWRLDLTGNGLGQRVIGNAGANRLDGAGGSDVLQGLGGADSFLFGSALGDGNVDRIVDFASEDDIGLSAAIFTSLAAGSLAVGALRITAGLSGLVLESDDFIVYDSKTGALYYDADANGAGSAVQFAQLVNKATLTALDFFVY